MSLSARQQISLTNKNHKNEYLKANTMSPSFHSLLYNHSLLIQVKPKHFKTINHWRKDFVDEYKNHLQLKGCNTFKTLTGLVSFVFTYLSILHFKNVYWCFQIDCFFLFFIFLVLIFDKTCCTLNQSWPLGHLIQLHDVH